MSRRLACSTASEAAATGTGTASDAWVMCLGELRPVGPDGVPCPRQPEVPVGLATCLDCHLLVTLSAERSSIGWCVVDGRD
jgi:hypothetical protein